MRSRINTLVLFFIISLCFFLYPPQILAADSHLFVASYAPNGSIWKINLNTLEKEQIVTDLYYPYGGICSSDGSTVFFSGLFGLVRFDGDGNNKDIFTIYYPRFYDLSINESDTLFINTVNTYFADPHEGILKIENASTASRYEIPTLVIPPFSKGGGMFMDKNENTYATAMANGKVFKFLKDSTSPIELISGVPFPYDIVVDSKGFIYVSDTVQQKIKKYTSDGEFVEDFIDIPEPRFLTIDSSDNIYITSEWTNTVYQIKPDKTKIALVTDISRPVGIALCGDGVGASVKPFLDLPWDYKTKKLSFTKAALAMTSFFDHEYPLLSTGLSEPPVGVGSIISYLGPPQEDESYSRHDGYDWGKQAKALKGEPMLAAADGVATYHGSCGACGNAIYIDHGNGFQTRYYHMLKDGLITSAEGEEIQVSKGQQIGKIGYSGNVKPKGEGGSHIHFMVVQDKNNDGSFDDNIPDGLVDPFGWQSTEPDPWPLYNFVYKGQERTGNKSNYLWIHPIANLYTTVDQMGKKIEIESCTIEILDGAVNEQLQVTAGFSPFSKITDTFESIGAGLEVTVKNSLNEPIIDIPGVYTLSFDFSDFDISRYQLDTLSIFSSEDGENWAKEETDLSIGDKIAKANLSHFSYFVLAGELVDTIAPITNIHASGTEGEEGWFRSDVELTLDMVDNEGGLGVDYTLYKINDGDWEEYQSPLLLNEEGDYIVDYYSIDLGENIEEIKSFELRLDKTNPEIKIQFDLQELDTHISGIDNNDVEIVIGRGRDDGNDEIIATDKSGNLVELEGKFDFQTNFDALEIKSIIYTNGANQVFNSNRETNRYTSSYKLTNTNQISYLEQKWIEEDGNQVLLIYRGDNNKTTIITKDTVGNSQKEVREGIIILSLQTDNGKLKYSY